MKNKKTTMLSVRIPEEEKEKLLDEANARGILLGEVVKEMITARVNDSSYDKNLMAGKKDVELPKEPCPFCGIVVDWGFVKINKLSSSADAKYCPNPDCREMVYTYSEEDGWKKWEGKSESKKEKSESKKEKSLYDLCRLAVLYKAGELCPRCFLYVSLEDEKCSHCGLVKDEWEAFKGKKIEEEEKIKEKKEESKKPVPEKKKEEKKEEKEKLIGTVFNDIITFDNEEESEEE